MSKFKQIVLNVFVKTLKEDEIEKLRKQFEYLDKDKNGMIHKDELV